MMRRRRGNKVHMTTNCVNIYLNNRTDKSREYRVLITHDCVFTTLGKKNKISHARFCTQKHHTDAAGSLFCFLLTTHTGTHTCYLQSCIKKILLTWWDNDDNDGIYEKDIYNHSLDAIISLVGRREGCLISPPIIFQFGS
jgi:hypothetical protein